MTADAARATDLPDTGDMAGTKAHADETGPAGTADDAHTAGTASATAQASAAGAPGLAADRTDAGAEASPARPKGEGATGLAADRTDADVAGLVLAAGRSERMGAAKAALDAGGVPFAARMVRMLASAGCAPVLVVLREAAGEAARAATAEGGVVVVNREGRGGQIGSLRAGLARLRESREPPSAVVFSPVDNPAVAAATVRTLMKAWRRSGAAVVVPRRGAKRGHPVLADMRIAGEFFEEGLAEGARGVIRRDPGRVLEVGVDDDAVLDDIDTPDEYRRRFRPPRAGTDPPS